MSTEIEELRARVAELEAAQQEQGPTYEEALAAANTHEEVRAVIREHNPEILDEEPVGNRRELTDEEAAEFVQRISAVESREEWQAVAQEFGQWDPTHWGRR